MKFSRLLNDDETEEFNQIQLHSTQIVQKQDYAIQRDPARCEFNPDIAILIGWIFSRDFPNMVLNENECSYALYNANHRELHVSTLMGCCLNLTRS